MAAHNPDGRWAVTVHNPAETEKLGETLGRVVSAGGVIVLDGDLGAGKTTFVRGLARGMGLPERTVSSPTFTLIHEYDGDVPLYHFDAYRLDDGQQFAELGADEYLYGEGVCAIEWGGNVRDELPEDRLELVLTAESPRNGAELGRAGQPRTYGCGGAEHWQMAESDIEPSTRRIEALAFGAESAKWLTRWRDAWQTVGRDGGNEELGRQ